MRLKKANCTVTTDSHFLDLNSAQPSVMSSHRLRRPAVAVPAVAVPAVPRAARHRQQAEREHARRVGRRVHGYHYGRPGQGDQDPAERWAADPGRRASQPVQGVGVAELVPGRDLHGKRVL